MSGSDHNRSGSEDDSSKPGLLVKKKKRSEKPGYKMFDADDSDSEPVLYDDSNRGPVTKLKKHSKPSFKFSGKIKLKEKEKDDKKDSVEKKEEKEPVSKRLTIRKLRDKDGKDKEHKHHKKKGKGLHVKAQLSSAAPVTVEAESPVFGVALSLAVDRNPCHDGVKVPVIVRECIDYIGEHGLLYEGIYRISGVKSKVQMLRDAYNRRQPAHLYEHDPSIVASLLKQFLRELPDPVLTSQLMHKFEQASVIPDNEERIESLTQCINTLPPHNRELLSWMIVHMNHIIAKEKINKMSIQNVSIVLSPTMRISHRVLNVLFLHSKELFSHIKITRYKPPLQPAASKWSVDLPETEEAIQEELNKQESLLFRLHQELSSHHHSSTTTSSDKEERLWEVQRNVTQLKRKLKLIAKTNAARQLEKQQLSSEPVKRSDPNRRSINAAELNFALSTGSLRKNARSSQVELATSVATSSEALPHVGSTGQLTGSGGHLRGSGGQLSSGPGGRLAATVSAPHIPEYDDRLSGQHAVAQQSATELSHQPVNPFAHEDRDSRKPPPLDLSTEQSDTIELSADLSADVSGLALSPEEELVVDVDVQSPEDEYAQTLTEQRFSQLTLQQKLSQASGGGIDVVVGGVEMKQSSSQDSDVTLYPEGEVKESTSHHSLSEYKQVPTVPITADTLQPSEGHKDEVVEGEVMAASIDSVETLPAPRGDGNILASASQEEIVLPPVAVEPVQISEPSVLEPMRTETIQHQHIAEGSAALLIPEKLHTAMATSPRGNDMTSLTGPGEDMQYDINDDDELRALIAEEAQLIWEEEELIAIKDELKQKISTEVIEIDRLNEEIAEYEELRSITTLGHSSEAQSSDEYYTSTSDTEPEDETAAQIEIDSLAAQLQQITNKNAKWELMNTELVNKIHEERMGCLNVKIQIRLLQQQMLGSQIQEQSLI